MTGPIPPPPAGFVLDEEKKATPPPPAGFVVNEAAPPPIPQPLSQQEDPSKIQGYVDTMQLGLSDAMSIMGGEQALDGIPDIGRGIKATSKVLSSFGEASGDAMIDAGKFMLPPGVPEAIEVGLKMAAESDPIQTIGRGLTRAREYLGPEASEMAGDVLNIATVAMPVKTIKPKAGIKSRAKLEKALQERKRLETERLLEPDNLRGPGILSETENVARVRKYKPRPGSPEDRGAKLVSEIPDIDPRRSNNYNTGVLNEEIGRINKVLIDDLADLPPIPIVKLENAIDDAIDAARELPNLTGSAGDVADSLSNYLNKQILIYKDAHGRITPSNLLKLRRKLDDWTERYGPADKYSEKGSAFSDANDEIRATLNRALIESAPDASVRKRLQDMSDLLTARDTLYPRSLPSYEKGNRFTRYIANLERSLGIKHPTNPQSAAITAQNPVVGVGVGLGALSLAGYQNIGKGMARNRTAAAEMMADAIRLGSEGAQKGALLDALNEDEKEYPYIMRR